MGLKGVVLAGGSGSRLYPLTQVTNKHLLPVYDRPMIFYALETLKEMGCQDVMVVVGGRSVGDILELLHDGSDLGLDLTYRYQRGALGIAHAIGLARSFAGTWCSWKTTTWRSHSICCKASMCGSIRREDRGRPVARVA